MLALFVIAGLATASRADFPYIPPVYKGPLLLLTPASNPADSLSAATIAHLAPDTKTVISAQGFHVLLNESRSTCYESGCDAYFTIGDGDKLSLVPRAVDSDPTILFSTEGDDEFNCSEEIEDVSGTTVQVRTHDNLIRALIGTGIWVAAVAECALDEISKAPRLPVVRLSEEAIAEGASPDRKAVRVQVGDAVHTLSPADVLRRIRHEESF